MKIKHENCWLHRILLSIGIRGSNVLLCQSALPSGDLQQGGNEINQYFHIIVGKPGPLTYRWIFKSWPQVPHLIKGRKVLYLHEKSNVLMIRKSG